jgi:hypothetical protein
MIDINRPDACGINIVFKILLCPDPAIWMSSLLIAASLIIQMVL